MTLYSSTQRPADLRIHRRRPRPRLALRLVGALLAMAGTFGLTGMERAEAATNPTYQVTVAGTVSGRAFRVVGIMTLAPTVTTVTNNGVNPLEACLAVGFPAGSPQTGAIWYGSNAACFSSSGSRLDLVFSSVSGSTYNTQPDGRYQATYTNNWTSSSSIAACLFSPVSGSTSYTFTTTGVTGRINLSGYGGAFCGWSNYTATISGVRIA